MDIGKAIEKRRYMIRMSQEELYIKLLGKIGLDIKEIEKGGILLNENEVKVIAQALHTTPSELYNNKLTI